MEGTRPFCVPFTLFIVAPESVYEWYEKSHIPDYLRDIAVVREGLPKALGR